MLIDMHAHSSGISPCCRIPAEEVINVCKNKEIDGIVLTNHYCKSYLIDGDALGFAQKYVDEYRLAKEFGDKHGVKVFFGIEITMELYDRVHLLVYGVNESFVLDNPDIYDLDQKTLYNLVKNNGGALIQAHPMRRGKNVLLDPDYLDGVEVNSHPLYDASHIDELSEIAAERGIIITSGGDYHADSKRAYCGAILPDGIKSEEISDFLLSTDTIEIFFQEPKHDEIHRAVFKRNCGVVEKS